MKGLLAVVRWELRLQARSWRSRAAVLVYVALCAVPPVFLLGRSHDFGPATFLDHLLRVQPFLTLLLTLLASGHRSGLATWPETWPVLASAPMGSGRYLLGRWAAVLALVVPVSAVPLLVAAGLAVAAGGDWPAAMAWLASWASRILPLVLVASALWLGAVTILGNELAALLATFVALDLAFAALNKLLFPLRLYVDLSLTLGAYRDLTMWTMLLRQRGADDYPEYFTASEAPMDVQATLEQALAASFLGGAVAVSVLALAVAYVRRTRRDLKPRPVRPDHPLRTYLPAILRLRERLAPGAGPSRGDLAVMGCGVLVLAGALAVHAARQRHFQGLAWERHAVETGDPFEPLGTEVKPRAWSVRGSIDGSAMDLEIAGTLAHEGGAPRSRLAFALNEHLAVEDLVVPGRRATYERAWDRLLVTVEPPLAAGETLELRWRLAGEPGELEFPFWYLGRDSFVTAAERFLTARFPRDLSDLSTSLKARAISPSGVELRAPALAPVPRYTEWTLTPRDLSGGREVPEETVLPEAELEIELSVPPGLVLADTCGHLSRRQDGRGRLAGRCRTALSTYAVYGGRLEVLEGDGVAFAALPAHRELAARYRESLAQAARLSQKAWPGLPGFDGLVAMEHRSGETMWWMWREFHLRGQLLLIHEHALATGFLPDGERLVADLLSRDLIARRPLDESQAYFFREAFAALMMQRMGVARQKDATVGGQPWLKQILAEPLIATEKRGGELWRVRLPAVLIDLENRVGSRALYGALDRFLAAGGPPGTVEELLALVEEESGVDLERFYRDFAAGPAMPELRLAGVEWRRQGRDFRVTGRVENHGTGEVVCPLLVKTELGTIKTVVTVGEKAPAAFDVSVTARPHTVHLDPEGTCHRWVTVGRIALERVELKG